jgi:hypothetical protein
MSEKSSDAVFRLCFSHSTGYVSTLHTGGARKSSDRNSTSDHNALLLTFQKQGAGAETLQFEVWGCQCRGGAQVYVVPDDHLWQNVEGQRTPAHH